MFLQLNNRLLLVQPASQIDKTEHRLRQVDLDVVGGIQDRLMLVVAIQRAVQP